MRTTVLFIVLLLSACAIDQPLIEDGGVSAFDDAGPIIRGGGGSTTNVGTDVQISNGGNIDRDGGIFTPPWVDGGTPKCICSIQPIEQPPEICIAKICYGDVCTTTFELLYCFYSGIDPIPDL